MQELQNPKLSPDLVDGELADSHTVCNKDIGSKQQLQNWIRMWPVMWPPFYCAKKWPH